MCVSYIIRLLNRVKGNLYIDIYWHGVPIINDTYTGWISSRHVCIMKFSKAAWVGPSGIIRKWSCCKSEPIFKSLIEVFTNKDTNFKTTFIRKL